MTTMGVKGLIPGVHLTWSAVSQVSTIQVEDCLYVSTGVNDRCFTVKYSPEISHHLTHVYTHSWPKLRPYLHQIL